MFSREKGTLNKPTIKKTLEEDLTDKKHTPGRISYTERSRRNQLYANISGISGVNLSFLKKQGMPGYLLKAPPLLISEVATTFSANSGNRKPRLIKSNVQITTYKKLASDIYNNGPFVYCISSAPNDLMAKIAGANLMHFANTLLKRDVPGNSIYRPLWHTLIGSYKCDLRDAPSKNRTSVLFLSNVETNSTQLKLELLRDILELYHNVPRVIITWGANPIEFSDKIGYSINHALYLQDKRVNTI